jgi:anaerobic magnesium-protoporphyrin IX monomethyl ester cyclase
MARVLLIYPVHAPTRAPYISVGLAYIAAALKAEGAEVECLDLNRYRPVLSDEQIEALIAERRFDVAGIGAMITSYKHVKWLCRTVKRLHPHAELWVGGSIVSPIPKLMLTDVPEVDVGVVGEGDETVRELYRAKVVGAEYANVAGIVCRRGGEVHQTAPRPRIADLDALPMPDWDIYPLTGEGGYLTTHGMPMPIVGHRGCPFECTYCYHDRAARAHSVDRVIAEVCRGVERFGAKRFAMLDDLFCANRTWVSQVCRRLIDLDLGITWSANVRVNTINQETIRLMKRAGCERVGMGFESASRRILTNIRKHATPELMSEALRICRAEGVRPSLTFMIGNEGEDVSTVAETIEFMKRELITAVMFFTTPYPGTPVYEAAKARGLIPDDVALFERYGEMGTNLVVNLTDLADDELGWLQKTAMRDIRRHYDKEHYKRVAKERMPVGARRVAIVGSGYEGENMVVAYRPLFEQLTLFIETGMNGHTHYRGVPIRPLGDLVASDYDAVVVADRTISPAVRELLERQGATAKMVHPYDEMYHFSKSL